MNRGILYATLAFTCWGLFPIYFHLLAHVPALEVVVHRIVWSLVFLFGVLLSRKHWAWLPELFRNPRVFGAFALSALLLSSNWLMYVWAVQNGAGRQLGLLHSAAGKCSARVCVAA
jgi:chloramphenicol-sensitive protein RarD